MITLTASAAYGQTGQYVARITGRDSKFTFAREFIGRKSNRDTSADVDEPGLYEVCDIDKKGRKESTFKLVLPNGDKLATLGTDKEDAMKIAKEMASRSFAEIVVLLPSCRAIREQNLTAVDLRKIANRLGYLADQEPAAAQLGWQVEPHQTTLGALFGREAANPPTCGELRQLVTNFIARLQTEIDTAVAAGKRLTAEYQILSPVAAAKAAQGQTIQSAIDACWTAIQALPTKDAKKVIKELNARLKPEPTTTTNQAPEGTPVSAP